MTKKSVVVGLLVLALSSFVMSSVEIYAQGTNMKVVTKGEPCENVTAVVAPFSTVHIDANSGSVKFVEYLSCDGVRQVASSDDGVMSAGYQAYTSPIDSSNIPSISLSQQNGLYILLYSPAPIEVRDAETGTLIASHPQSGTLSNDYTISSAELSAYVNKLIVVDVKGHASGHYDGTASFPYVVE